MTGIVKTWAAAAVLVAAVTPYASDARPRDEVRASAPDRAASARLRVYVTPGVATAPATVRIRALVERDEDNRDLEFVADSGLYYRSSTIALSGADAARLHSVEFRSMPAGTYDVRVVLRDGNGRIRSAEHHRVVLLE